jgi:fumarylacetoacetate (FAA) hydrolase
MPDHFEKLDFELEAAIVVCKHGRNIKAVDADEYIGGLMIMNDLSARKLQMEEMLLNLGPAKEKIFLLPSALARDIGRVGSVCCAL